MTLTVANPVARAQWRDSSNRTCRQRRLTDVQLFAGFGSAAGAPTEAEAAVLPNTVGTRLVVIVALAPPLKLPRLHRADWR